MRITYRYDDVKQYWRKRWTAIPVDSAMENTDAYPLKYAELAIGNNPGTILEAGCGVGRVVMYYKNKGYKIVGIDYIDEAITKLKKADLELDVAVGDITHLEFADSQFDYVLAFGLYHNLEQGLEKAIAETFRVLAVQGKVCASFRADNIQTRLTDWLTEFRSGKTHSKNAAKHFHKMNLTRTEFSQLFAAAGFYVEQIYPVENMPILYKFALFRSKEHKVFNENMARKEGYRLSTTGQLLQNGLMRFFANQFCNIYVIIASKP